MFRELLVPLDEYSLAECVLEHIGWLAPAKTTELAFVSVVEPSHYYPYTYSSGVDTRPERIQARQYVQRYLEGRRARLSKQGYRVTVQVLEGDPAEEILAWAKEWRPDRNEHPWSFPASPGGHLAVLPSMSSKAQPCQILWCASRRLYQFSRRYILLPLDGSEAAGSVIHCAGSRAKHRGHAFIAACARYPGC